MSHIKTAPAAPFRVHGLSCSYFTGKLEAYLRAKGLDYSLVEMDTAGFRRCAQITGVLQMPQLEGANGQWMTDTTDIIRHYESEMPDPALSPEDPLTRFVSRLLEGFADEWLWRPAMYYRWQFREDATAMGRRLGSVLLRDMKLPLFVRAMIIRRRQQRVFLKGNGVTAQTRPQIEALYLRTLDALEQVFAVRPFMLGARPVEADFGMFGPMFRHFSIDPTAAQIMRARAPRVLEWTARLWAVRPQDFAVAPLPDGVPADIQPLLDLCAGEYLPYLAANASAYAAARSTTEFVQDGVQWRVPTNPFAVRCLNDLRGLYAALDAGCRSEIVSMLGPAGDILAVAPQDFDVAPLCARTPLDHHFN